MKRTHRVAWVRPWALRLGPCLQGQVGQPVPEGRHRPQAHLPEMLPLQKYGGASN